MIESDWLVHFFTTKNPALAANLIFRNYRHVILYTADGVLFEFFKSADLLRDVESFEKGNDGIKRLLGIHSRMSAIKGVRP